ncbi:putative ATP synthase gamma chain [Candidatus Xenohaliotis californiensis]|uniref:ATP synthase gamma chain n=1 Tax=Candidatus Xenohaliotis californiensis TaxID=84677 RepID=A0ABP0EV83_9RICK|nr:putative ATP synthase gamma chain [Candidatus Xenohaliotis californiensis]
MKGDIKALQQRIKTVGATKKIASVMRLIASSKYQTYHKLLISANEYNRHLTRVAHDYFQNIDLPPDIYKPALFNNKPSNKVLLVCISSNKGLCGNFNQLINNNIDSFIEINKNKEISAFTIGAKAEKHIQTKHKSDVMLIPHKCSLTKNPKYEHFVTMASLIANFFLCEKFESVHMIFSHFVSSVERKVVSEILLPIPQPPTQKEYSVTAYEPSSHGIIENLSWQMLKSKLYQNMISNYVSEHCARMLAMDNASKNASDISDRLMLECNSMRQDGITTELLEIIAGSETIKKNNI